MADRLMGSREIFGRSLAPVQARLSRGRLSSTRDLISKKLAGGIRLMRWSRFRSAARAGCQARSYSALERLGGKNVKVAERFASTSTAAQTTVRILEEALWSAALEHPGLELQSLLRDFHAPFTDLVGDRPHAKGRLRAECHCSLDSRRGRDTDVTWPSRWGSATIELATQLQTWHPTCSDGG